LETSCGVAHAHRQCTGLLSIIAEVKVTSSDLLLMLLLEHTAAAALSDPTMQLGCFFGSQTEFFWNDRKKLSNSVIMSEKVTGEYCYWEF